MKLVEKTNGIVISEPETTGVLCFSVLNHSDAAFEAFSDALCIYAQGGIKGVVLDVMALSTPESIGQGLSCLECALSMWGPDLCLVAGEEFSQAALQAPEVAGWASSNPIYPDVQSVFASGRCVATNG